MHDTPVRQADGKLPRVLRVDPERPDPRVIAEAARVILAGGLVGFGTETVYGLGARAMDPAAIARLYAAKGRPAHNPLIAHVATARAARALAATWNAAAERFAAAFWPGPVTLIVRRAVHAPDCLSAGRDTLAVRVPASMVALRLLEAVGEPVAAPSANPSGRLSPTRAEHVVEGLGNRVDLVLDSGPATLGIESSVIDVSGARPRLVRPGTLTHGELAAVVAELEGPHADPGPGAARASPGLDASHYAPRARVHLVDRTTLAARALAPGEARIVRTALGDGTGVEIVLGEGAREWAARLYEVLHGLDARGVDAVWVESPPNTEAWAGIADRLRRAAAPRH